MASELGMCTPYGVTTVGNVVGRPVSYSLESANRSLGGIDAGPAPWLMANGVTDPGGLSAMKWSPQYLRAVL